jgi:RNA polymerase sigma-70 factor (ECF subfamily)
MMTRKVDLADERTDPELCRAAADEGSERAFAALHSRYRERIYSLAFTYLGNPDEAEDVTQEVFVRAYRAMGSFKGQSQFFTWLYRIALNCCKDWVKQAHYVRCDRRDDLWWSGCPEGSSLFGRVSKVEQSVERREARALLEQALAKLSPEFREALVLREVDGLSYREIGQVLGCSEGTVKSRIFRSRFQMRRILQAVRSSL